jgi:glycosyltransferase involved in cell wall biosynthesis
MNTHRHCRLKKKKNRAAAHMAFSRSRKSRQSAVDAATHARPAVAAQAGEPAAPVYPLISCIMPTAGRPAYVAHSVQLFMAQDYPCKELIIGFNDLSDLPAIDWPAAVRLVQIKTYNIGAKRNECCSYAQGAIIAQWDDDDIYNNHRLSLQAAPIIAGQAHITGLNNFVFYEIATGYCYTPADALFSGAFRSGIHSGTLMYHRAVWDTLTRYPALPCGEDYGFMSRAVKKGAMLTEIDGYGSFVYVRHAANTWKFEENNFRKYNGWSVARLPAWAARFIPFYSHMAAQKKKADAQVLPKVHGSRARSYV